MPPPGAWEMVLAFPLLMAVVFVSGCGYSLELSKLEEQKEREDPVTLIRRNLRQIKADHRVAIFDLRKEQKEQIKQLGDRLQEAKLALSQRSADIDERISEMEVHHRLIQGSIEEEANRFKEISEQASDFALRELEELKNDFSHQGEERKKLEQNANQRVASVQQKVKGQVSALQSQIDALQGITRRLEKSLNKQSLGTKDLSDQLSQVIEKILPAVNNLGKRVDVLEWQLKKMDADIDVDTFNRRLSGLTDAIDIQRQSLEMLGNTLTSQVDEQRALLRQAIDRLTAIESSPTLKPQ